MKKKIDTSLACIRNFMVLIIFCITSGSAASSFFYSGFVTGGSGAGTVLTPAGDLVYLLFEIDSLQPGDLVNGGDITSLEFHVGGICFAQNACTLGGTWIPAIDVETDMMTYTPFTNDWFDGELNFVGFSPTIIVALDINIDFDALLFTIEFGPLGSINGCLNEVPPESEPCYPPVPVPGAILFLGSALLMLGAIRRHA